MTNLNLPIPPELIEAIDRLRGDVPRAAWIRRAILERLERDKR